MATAAAASSSSDLHRPISIALLNQTPYSTTSEGLRRSSPVKSPEEIGLKPIADYNYLSRNTPRIRASIGEEGLAVVKKNIEDLVASNNKVFFLDQDNPLVAIVKSNGQIFWKAVDTTCKSQVKQIGDFVLSKRQTLCINTGTHGDLHGNIVADNYVLSDGIFSVQDLSSFNDFTLDEILDFKKLVQRGLLEINTMSGELPKPHYPRDANHVIDAWCFSVQTLYTGLAIHEYCFDTNGDYTPSHLRCPISEELLEDPVYFSKCEMFGGRVHFFDRKTIEHIIKERGAHLDRNFTSVLVGGTTEPVPLQFTRSATDRLIDQVRQTNALVFRRGFCPIDRCTASFDIQDLVKAGTIIDKIKEDVVAHKAYLRQLKAERSQSTGRITTLEGDKAALEGERDGLREQVAEDAQTITQTTAGRVAETNRADSAEQARDVAQDTVKAQEAQLNEAQVQVRQQAQVVQEQVFRIDDLSRRNTGLAHQNARLAGNETPEIHRENQLVRKMLDRHGYALIKTTMESQMESAKAGLAHRLQGGVVSWLMPLSYERATAFVESGVPDRRQIENTNALATLFLDRNKGPVKQKALKGMAFHSLNPKRGSSSAITFDGFEFGQFVSPMMNQLLSTDNVSGRLIFELKGNKVHLREIIMEPHRWSTEKEDYGLVFEAATYKEVLTSLFAQCLRYEFSKRINEVADIVDRV